MTHSLNQQLKTHFLLYGAMITFVVVLFRLTSAYGEANLMAPPNVDGRYLSDQAPPGCPESSQLALTIQQSGVFLNGDVALPPEQAAQANSAMGTTRPLPLHGRWQDEQIHLTGDTAALNCATSSAPTPVTVQGTVTLGQEIVFSGQVMRENAPPWSFTAAREVTSTPMSEH